MSLSFIVPIFQISEDRIFRISEPFNILIIDPAKVGFVTLTLSKGLAHRHHWSLNKCQSIFGVLFLLYLLNLLFGNF